MKCKTVHHGGAGGYLPGHLMHVRARRDASAEIQELPDSLLGEERYDPDEETPVGQRELAGLREGGNHLPGRGPVHPVVVLTAQILIMYWVGNHTCRPERGYVMSA